MHSHVLLRRRIVTLCAIIIAHHVHCVLHSPVCAAHLEDLEDDDSRVKFFWQAMNNFSSEDRSRLLRFVTGRRRLPAPVYLCRSNR